MHTVHARPVTRDDLVEGLQVYRRHGTGFVPATLTDVKVSRDTRRVPINGSGEFGDVIRAAVHYNIKSVTGAITNGSFYSDGEDPGSWPANVKVTERSGDPIFLLDPNGEEIKVLDIIGHRVSAMVFLSGSSAEAARERLMTALTSAGFRFVDEPEVAPCSEQRVLVRGSGASNDGKVKIMYEWEHLPAGAQFDYIELME